jgi:hypothetical protein
VCHSAEAVNVCCSKQRAEDHVDIALRTECSSQ